METEHVTQMRIGIEAAKDDIRLIEKAVEISNTEGFLAGLAFTQGAEMKHENITPTKLTEEAYNRVMDKYRSTFNDT